MKGFLARSCLLIDWSPRPEQVLTLADLARRDNQTSGTGAPLSWVSSRVTDKPGNGSFTAQGRPSVLRRNEGLAVLDYWFRSATIGSTPAARRAGTSDASSAAKASVSTASASMIGFHGVTPNS